MIIEAGCIYNQGRSPLFEAFANKWIARSGREYPCEYPYRIISSGTHVLEIDACLNGEKDVPIEEPSWLWMIQQGIERGIVDRNYASLLKGKLEGDRLALARILALEAGNVFQTEEHLYRSQAFEIFSLGKPKPIHEQTVARPDVALFLGMGKSNIKAAKEIYQGAVNAPENCRLDTTQVPVFETLAGYACNEPGKEFESAFGKGVKDYLEMAEQIRDFTHKSLKKALNLRTK